MSTNQLLQAITAPPESHYRTTKSAPAKTSTLPKYENSKKGNLPGGFAGTVFLGWELYYYK